MNYLAVAKDVFSIESDAVKALSEQLGDEFVTAVDTILRTQGRVVICGMGKSGLIGQKIAATLSSTGTPSFFMHPGEAYHGDLGMIGHQDVFVAISNSGETEEVVKLLPFLKENGNFLIAMTGGLESSLARASDVTLNIRVSQEACPLQLAPTASTTATLAMGDALAVTLMRARNFQPEQFARFHPGGSLGRRLLAQVEDEMLTDNLPVIVPEAPFATVVDTITTGKLGLAIVTLAQGYGIITDGDIRRAFNRYGKEVFELKAQDLFSPHPKYISVDAKMSEAFALMEQNQITSLLVVDQQHQLVGIVKK
ncbi:Arabinose-5-phosphate isomerase [Saliniradius amylolyticus]|uniref:Arabinose 5-phosphate isomerase n=1 Tax=Saliniradius amylolyticus TaxID=2183582 RepID=A0A2S2E4H8_9ALTE|nr:KpsF/GutQ family sugar-phosphate isomerase [Saliniradius amylolyticus]AWL12568.1 Arabinose-5-phosphate isomerase [Saliniradius amylolyticus]